MKIALGVATYYPKSVGGTEKYVHELAKYLNQNSIETIVITPTTDSSSVYEYEGYQVHTFSVPKEFNDDEIQGKTICRGYEGFENIIKKFAPTVFHLHTLSIPLSTYHLEIVKNLDIHTIFTAHIPGTFCPKGDLITHQDKVCDGKLEADKCGYCYAKWRHKNSFLGEITGRLSQSNTLSQLLSSKLPQLSIAQKKIQSLEHLQQNTSLVIPVCQWLYDMFVLNGFSKNQLRICRQGVMTSENQKIRQEKTDDVIKIGFLGRLSPEKGLHNLLDAFLKANLPNLELHLVVIKLEFYDNYEYFEKIDKMVELSDKIYYQENMPSHLVNHFLDSIDVLAVPSICLETGPLTVYEALQRKVPVVGSNIGGIKELIEDNKTGLLYNFNDIDALKTIFINISKHPSILGSLRKNISTVRSVEDVGEEMAMIYQQMI